MKRRFDAGEIIFREGDVSLSVYVITSGEVEIYKETGRGSITLAIIGKGDMFGEMGAVDKVARSANARANSEVAVDILSRTEFLHDLDTKPGMAIRVIEMMVARRRDTEILLWKAHAGAPLPLAVTIDTRKERKGGGLLARLFGRRRKAETAASHAPEKGPLVVLLAAITGDYEGGMVSRRIQASLDQLPGSTVRPLNHYISGGDAAPADSVEPEQKLAAAAAHARRVLSRGNGDLVIWGEVEEGGRMVELRLLPAVIEDRPGTYLPELVLNLPLEFEEEWVFLLRGAVLSTLDPRTEAQTAAIRAGLTEAVETAKALAESGMSGLSATEQASVLVAHGNAAAALGNLDQHNADWYHSAITAYRKAVRFMSAPTIDRPLALVHRLLGLAFQAAGERMDDPELLERAADSYRLACQAITRDQSPREWGIMQSRLGVVLYRLDLKTGRSIPLKEALSAYQGALQVITRADDPFRWAEIMNNLAQALQVYGDHVRSAEVLARAVDACRAALEVRNQDAAPLLWAATQNNMGSALFLLARHANDSEHLHQAVEAFRGALSVYEIHGAIKMATVTEKNLAHAERSLSTHSRRRVAKPHWSGEEPPHDKGSTPFVGVRLRPADPDDDE